MTRVGYKQINTLSTAAGDEFENSVDPDEADQISSRSTLFAIQSLSSQYGQAWTKHFFKFC